MTDTIIGMATDDASLVFPIGHCIGASYDPAEPTEHSFQVRVGADVIRLDDARFAIWGLAHGLPERPLEQPWGREGVLDAARRAGVPWATRVLDALIEDHMLCETTAGTDSALDFARRYRMIPLMLGLGNTAEEPLLYSVGMVGQPVVAMSAMAYDLYEWAHMDSSIWLACEGAAATAVRVGVEDPDATDPVHMLDALLGTLHVLLSPNAVCLDTRLAD